MMGPYTPRIPQERHRFWTIGFVINHSIEPQQFTHHLQINTFYEDKDDKNHHLLSIPFFFP